MFGQIKGLDKVCSRCESCPRGRGFRRWPAASALDTTDGNTIGSGLGRKLASGCNRQCSTPNAGGSPEGPHVAKEPRLRGLRRRRPKWSPTSLSTWSRRPLSTVGFGRRAGSQRRVRALLVVEGHPIRDHQLGREPVAQLPEIHGLVLQRAPQPLDEDVVQPLPATVHRAPRPAACTRPVKAAVVNCAPWSVLKISGVSV